MFVTYIVEIIIKPNERSANFTVNFTRVRKHVRNKYMRILFYV